MGDPSASKKAAIPSWQQKPHDISPQPNTVSESRNKSLESPSREPLFDQASRFLQDESIRDASTDRKIAFLESKGLKKDDIQKLLGGSREPDAGERATATTATVTGKPESPPTQASQPNSEPPLVGHPAPSSAPVTSRSVPPIITYPEFLLQHPKPPPLVTFHGVLYALYGAAGVAASIYGASQHLVVPMLNALTVARHELAETAQYNLLKLNEKLEKNVSTIPPIPTELQRLASGEEVKNLKGWEDTESITSDPTELFHRDIATQTTPDLEQSVSTHSPTADPVDSPTSGKIMLNQHKRLQSMLSYLNGFLTAENEESATYMSVRDRVSEFQTYLDSLAFGSPSYMNSGPYGVYVNESRDWMGRDGRANQTNKEDDAISAFRAEIRSVKGTLLSAKNFPQSSPALRPVGMTSPR